MAHAKGDGLEVGQAFEGFLSGVKRQGGFVFGKAMAVGEFGVFFLQVAGIRQQNRAQLGSRTGAIDGAAEAVFDQEWQVAGMIEVSMGQNDGVDAVRFDGKWRPILEPQRLESLEQATIDKNAMVAVLNGIF